MTSIIACAPCLQERETAITRISGPFIFWRKRFGRGSPIRERIRLFAVEGTVVPQRSIPAHRFVVFTQNHDQVGNRMKGERLGVSVSFEALKLCAGCVLLSPFVPLLFMGEEYGETAPFPYFVSHSDPRLIESVREGRREEFSAFTWQGEPPDPQSEETFLSAKLDHALKTEEVHRTLLGFYKALIALRKENEVLAHLSKETMDVAAMEREEILLVRRWKGRQEWAMVFHFGKKDTSRSFALAQGPLDQTAGFG